MICENCGYEPVRQLPTPLHGRWTHQCQQCGILYDGEHCSYDVRKDIERPKGALTKVRP